jgi:hypothetical protein
MKDCFQDLARVTRCNEVYLGFVLVLTISHLVACAERKPNVSAPPFYERNRPLGTSSEDGKNPLWLYVEVQNNIKEETLKQIAALAEILEAVKPAGVTIPQFLRMTYGTSSEKVHRLFIAYNPQLHLSGDSLPEANVFLFGGPVFSKGLTDYIAAANQNYEMLSLPYTLGNAYLRVKPELAAAPSKLQSVVASIRKSDAAVRELAVTSEFTLVPSWGLTQGDLDCSAYAAVESSPYESLGTWHLAADYKEKYQTVTIAVIDSGMALGEEAPSEGGPPPLNSQEFDPRIPLWQNPTPRSSAQPQAPQDTTCTGDRNGCNIPDGNGSIGDFSIQSEWYGHGTHVAGLCSGFSIQKVAIPREKIEIMVLKIQDRWNRIDPFVVSAALDYAVAHEAKIVNMSLIGPIPEGLNRAVHNAQQEGVLIVAAAGNSANGPGKQLTADHDSPHYPAKLDPLYTNVVTVAALDGGGNPASFSNWGDGVVTIAAPGVRVESTLPGGQIGKRCGTSQAAPLVTLTAAMILMQSPHLKPEDMKLRLQASSDYIPGLKGKIRWGGKLNMQKAVSFSEDLIETRTNQIFTGRIRKTEFLKMSGPDAYPDPLPWSEVLRIDLDIDGKDRVLWLGSERRLVKSEGRVALDRVLLLTSDGKPLREFKREEIRDIVLKFPPGGK